MPGQRGGVARQDTLCIPNEVINHVTGGHDGGQRMATSRKRVSASTGSFQHLTPGGTLPP